MKKSENRGPGRYSNRKRRGSVLEARRKDYDQHHREYEKANGQPGSYTRPGSRQDG